MHGHLKVNSGYSDLVVSKSGFQLFSLLISLETLHSREKASWFKATGVCSW